MSDDGQRRDLAALLRSRREQLDRAAFGLPDATRRRGMGLRREEVAALSGVSLSWYTWLEQARDVHPSRQVLDALAVALRLTSTEHAYLLSLAGFAATTIEPRSPAEAPEHIQHLLDALEGSPAFAITSDWSISAWNDSYRALYPNVATVPAAERNLLWAVFADPFVRELLPDWEITSRRFLAEFRAEAGPRLTQPDCVSLVRRLARRSPQFKAGWARHDVEGFTSRRRNFTTTAGPLEFEHHRLAASDQHDLFVVIYTSTSADTTRRLRRLRRESPD